MSNLAKVVVLGLILWTITAIYAINLHYEEETDENLECVVVRSGDNFMWDEGKWSGRDR